MLKWGFIPSYTYLANTPPVSPHAPPARPDRVVIVCKIFLLFTLYVHNKVITAKSKRPLCWRKRSETLYKNYPPVSGKIYVQEGLKRLSRYFRVGDGGDGW